MIGFAQSALDRLDAVRDRPEAVAALAARADARVLCLDGLDPRLDESGRLTWRTLLPGEPLALLGAIGESPHFAALGPVPHGAGRSEALFAALDRIAAGDAGTFAAARSLVDWHARHGFCANCGHATTPARAGWMRTCPGCGAEHFPRTDPVVIMLAEHGGRALVGRQHRFPPGRYSALAGFLEVGETIESAVARELWEEAGVRATAVRYVASQPWPFPSSLMIACIAPVVVDRLTLDATEIEDAFWVTRDEARAALAGDPDARFLAPPPYAIAHSLLAAWVGGATLTDSLRLP